MEVISCVRNIIIIIVIVIITAHKTLIFVLPERVHQLLYTGSLLKIRNMAPVHDTATVII